MKADIATAQQESQTPIRKIMIIMLMQMMEKINRAASAIILSLKNYKAKCNIIFLISLHSNHTHKWRDPVCRQA